MDSNYNQQTKEKKKTIAHIAAASNGFYTTTKKD